MRTKPAAAALAATALVLSLAATLGLSTTAGAAGDDQRAAAATSTAKRALTTAQGVMAGTYGKPTRDATMALRDLHKALANLNDADRKTAESILSRPTDPSDTDAYSVPAESLCGASVCLHWVESSGDAVALTDTSPANGTPDYVDLVLSTMEGVHSTYIGAGYKPPKPDGTRGGNAKPDVYLANIGSQGLYGYCDSDEPVVEGQYDYWTYCVLDNDFSADEFPGPITPIQNMRVTAAHEYFHAVQAAYDWWEDRWLMEATATWSEDELFDDVNDNVYYLTAGQLGAPWAPLDGRDGFNIYGNWIFFRFLTEQIPAVSGGMPTLVRKIWENADSTNGPANNEYSLEAVSNALADAGASFRDAYTFFALANRDPGAYYEEGVENSYPTPPLSFKPVTLTPKKRKTKWGNVKQDHLTNDTVRFQPGSKMKQSGWKLKVQVNMAPANRGSVAMVTVHKKFGAAKPKQIRLNGQGDGATKVPFSKSKVSYVELTMVNASERTNCWVGEGGVPYSCYGIPLDDNLKAEFRGVASK